MLDSKLVVLLQRIRDHFGVSVNINSGYRCEEHNKAVGGVSSSNHKKGMAADIRVKGIDALEVAKYAESIGIQRIGYYDKEQGDFVHIGSGTTKSFWKNATRNYVTTFGGKKEEKTVTLNMPVLKKGAKSDTVKTLQILLNGYGYKMTSTDGKTEYKPDGSFGGATERALIKYQNDKGLVGDGSAGRETWESLLQI
jgi:murein L,D-transpeptidase YcbB/YkuD